MNIIVVGVYEWGNFFHIFREHLPLFMQLNILQKAYEEMAVHNQLDKRKTKDSVSELHLRDQNEASANVRMDAAKQKESLLTYVGYMNARHDEILNSFEKGQEKER